MFNKNKFKAKVVESGMTLSDVAKALGIDDATLYRKMNVESDFYRKEIEALRKLLNIENPVEIFLRNILRKRKIKKGAKNENRSMERIFDQVC